jgi:hypothetical protein
MEREFLFFSNFFPLQSANGEDTFLDKRSRSKPVESGLEEIGRRVPCHDILDKRNSSS